MLSLLLYLACAVFDPYQAELDRIVRQHKAMGHPALSAHGIDMDEHGRIYSQGYIFVWHSPANTIVSGSVLSLDGAKTLIITMPLGVEPTAEAKQGVKQQGVKK